MTFPGAQNASPTFSIVSVSRSVSAPTVWHWPIGLPNFHKGYSPPNLKSLVTPLNAETGIVNCNLSNFKGILHRNTTWFCYKNFHHKNTLLRPGSHKRTRVISGSKITCWTHSETYPACVLASHQVASTCMQTTLHCTMSTHLEAGSKNWPASNGS